MGVTMHTVMIWNKSDSISMVMVSDNKSHDKSTAVPYTTHVLKYVKELYEDSVKNIEIWTDGPSSQFKIKFMFGFIGITLPKVFPEYQITWNYSATSHGKGAVDGLRGTVKRLAIQAIITRKAIIKDAKSLHDAISEKAKEDAIKESLLELEVDELWTDINGVPGTLHIHCICAHNNGVNSKMFTNDAMTTFNPLVASSELAKVVVANVQQYKKGDYVAVKYDNKYFPGEVLEKLNHQSAKLR